MKLNSTQENLARFNYSRLWVAELKINIIGKKYGHF